MSLINSRAVAKLYWKNQGVIYTVIRNHWNKDFKPGPFPKTQEEREAAAKKYNLLPSEYKPFPDGSYGDYPELPDISGDSKDPYYPYDNPELKRNFNEPLHVEADAISEDRYDISARHRIPRWEQFAQFLGVLFGTGLIYYLLEPYRMFPAVAPKSYPQEGKTHYTFDHKQTVENPVE